MARASSHTSEITDTANPANAGFAVACTVRDRHLLLMRFLSLSRVAISSFESSDMVGSS